jgi:hypothetical protein
LSRSFVGGVYAFISALEVTAAQVFYFRAASNFNRGELSRSQSPTSPWGANSAENWAWRLFSDLALAGHSSPLGALRFKIKPSTSTGDSQPTLVSERGGVSPPRGQRPNPGPEPAAAWRGQPRLADYDRRPPLARRRCTGGETLVPHKNATAGRRFVSGQLPSTSIGTARPPSLNLSPAFVTPLRNWQNRTPKLPSSAGGNARHVNPIKRRPNSPFHALLLPAVLLFRLPTGASDGIQNDEAQTDLPAAVADSG